MVKVFIVYEREPDSERYARHVEVSRAVPGARFRHGRVFANPFGEPDFAYYAEFEFDDMQSFRATVRTPEWTASGEDAARLGVPFRVHFAELT